MMVQVIDEVFDSDGNVVSAISREVEQDTPSDVELFERRQELTALLDFPGMPPWGRMVIQYVLQATRNGYHAE